MLRFLSSTFQVSDKIIDELSTKYCDNCTVCGGKRTVTTSTGRQKCKCLEKYNKEYSLYEANVPKEFHTMSRNDLTMEWVQDNRATYERAIKYSKQLDKALSKGFGLYLVGKSGAGKSFIASLLLKRALQEGHTGYFILLRDLVAAGINAMRDPDLQNDVNYLVTEVDFLVLDDVDKVTAAKNQELVSTVLMALLKKRKYHGKPLIVTSGCPMDTLPRQIGGDLARTITSGLSELYYTGDANSKRLQALEDEFFNGS